MQRFPRAFTFIFHARTWIIGGKKFLKKSPPALWGCVAAGLANAAVGTLPMLALGTGLPCGDGCMTEEWSVYFHCSFPTSKTISRMLLFPLAIT
jgi:hypothetical protein